MQIEGALLGVAELLAEAQLNKIGRYSKWYLNKRRHPSQKYVTSVDPW